MFVAQWQIITRDHFIVSVVCQGFSDFSSIQFSGGVTGSHCTPQGSKSSPSYLQRNPRVDSKENHRPNRRFFITLLFTYFCDSQEHRGSSGDFESEVNQCFHFGTTFPYGNSQFHSTESAPSRLSSLDRFEGRLPSRTGIPSVQGLAFRPKRLSVGLFEGSSYGNSSPSPAGHPDIYFYLDDWLLVAESQLLLQSHLLATLQLAQSLGFIVFLKISVLTPQRMPVYLGASLDFPRWIALVPFCRLLMRPLQLHFL